MSSMYDSNGYQPKQYTLIQAQTQLKKDSLRSKSRSKIKTKPNHNYYRSQKVSSARRYPATQTKSSPTKKKRTFSAHPNRSSASKNTYSSIRTPIVHNTFVSTKLKSSTNKKAKHSSKLNRSKSKRRIKSPKNYN
jgi:hypothetical protein